MLFLVWLGIKYCWLVSNYQSYGWFYLMLLSIFTIYGVYKSNYLFIYFFTRKNYWPVTQTLVWQTCSTTYQTNIWIKTYATLGCQIVDLRDLSKGPKLSLLDHLRYVLGHFQSFASKNGENQISLRKYQKERNISYPTIRHLWNEKS